MDALPGDGAGEAATFGGLFHVPELSLSSAGNKGMAQRMTEDGKFNPDSLLGYLPASPCIGDLKSLVDVLLLSQLVKKSVTRNWKKSLFLRSDPHVATLVTSSDLGQVPPAGFHALCDVVTDECLHAQGFSQAPLTRTPQLIWG